MSTTTIVDDLEQLSTTTSRSETPTPDRQDGSAEAASKVLQVPAGPFLQEARLHRTLKPIHGLLPHDEPLEHDATLSILDRRLVPSLSIRYRCINCLGLITDCLWQDQIIRSVWTYLRQLLPDDFKQQKTLPSVVFGAQPDAEGRYAPCIDIALPTVKTFLVVRSKLDVIEVKRIGIQTLKFVQYIWQNSLPPDVLPLDIVRFPLVEASLDVFFDAIKHMASPVGTALGAGLVCVSESGSSEEASPTNTVRVYIKLNGDGMRLKATELVDRLPGRFEWKGAVYTCRFAGQLRRELKVSASYPLQQVGTAPAPAPAAAAAKKNPVPVGSASSAPTVGTRVATSMSSTPQAAPAIKTNAGLSATGGTTAGTGAAVGMSSSSQAAPAAEKSPSAGMTRTTGVCSSNAAATSFGASRTASSRTQEQEEGACTPA